MKIAFVLFCSLFICSFTSPILNQTNLRVGNLDFELGGDVRVQVFKKQPIDILTELKPVVKLQVALEKAPYINLPELEPGEYMIAVFHDSNKNGKMDYSFFGSPKEGYGFSGEFYCNRKNPLPELHYVRLNSGTQDISVNVCY
ncbi:DUF2141 domain-containing protein [Cyclobacterium qasimii]|uniref:DUF2141 domain-containing protein n=2 Tax=Cyclobacterium qasimii TaxID=1350429 RepID=S7VNE8_9BACT|nr:DUF2141 domain-containing protein [Cyclobacterium qasimii]EPR71700.1 hypothetical protein ADICYQ_0171 [Cyclobacterium qasimii M12-11B]GEO22400.1 hypothetical protein CQA01_29340 [Cyclobacterium qasimii]